MNDYWRRQVKELETRAIELEVRIAKAQWILRCVAGPQTREINLAIEALGNDIPKYKPQSEGEKALETFTEN